MRKKNDGRGRLGGRQKGTPNKVTASMREWIAKVLDDNKERFVSDLLSLNPKDRLTILTRLIEFVIPKRANYEEEVPEKKLTLEEMCGVPEGAIPNDVLIKAATLIQDSIDDYLKKTGDF